MPRQSTKDQLTSVAVLSAAITAVGRAWENGWTLAAVLRFLPAAYADVAAMFPWGVKVGTDGKRPWDATARAQKAQAFTAGRDADVDARPLDVKRAVAKPVARAQRARVEKPTLPLGTTVFSTTRTTYEVRMDRNGRASLAVLETSYDGVAAKMGVGTRYEIERPATFNAGDRARFVFKAPVLDGSTTLQTGTVQAVSFNGFGNPALVAR
jgi:hypothetical protein